MVKKTKTYDWIWQQPDWPAFTWNETDLALKLRKINQLQGRLLGSSRAVDAAAGVQSELDALLQNAIKTSEIEGESLNVESVRSSLARRLGVEQAGLTKATPQTDGLADILLDATRNPDVPLSLERLFHWHAALFPDGTRTGMTPVLVGQLRGDEPMQVVSGRIDKPIIHYEAPPREGLEKELEAFIQWFNMTQGSADLDPVLRAGIAHLWFVTLHPFDDGNGRMARAVTDLALAQAEHQSVRFYAISATIMDNRKTYYEILEKTQRGSVEITKWLDWFLTMLQVAMEVAEKQIEYVLHKAKFWQRHAMSNLNERQVKVLNRLLDAGPEGFEGGLNARKYMSLTSVSKATATRDLTDLVEKGCLIQRSAGGRSTSYDINWLFKSVAPLSRSP